MNDTIQPNKFTSGKVGAAQRILTFAGSGTLRTWREPGGLANSIQSALVANGWGVQNVKIFTNPTIPQTIIGGVWAGIVTYNYSISIDVNAMIGDNPERIRTALVAYLSDYFTDIRLTLVAGNLQSTNPTTGATVNVNSGDVPKGFFESLNDTLGGNNTAGKIAGLSIGTFALLAVAGIIIVPMLLRPNMPLANYNRSRYA